MGSWLVGWFCCFTSQVNSYGHCGTVSSPNHTFSWAGLNKRLTSNLCTYFRLYEAGIELATPGSAVRHASVARHVTDCATRPVDGILTEFKLIQAFIVVLLICKNEYDPFKIESTRVVTAFLQLLVYGDFSRCLRAANS